MEILRRIQAYVTNAEINFTINLYIFNSTKYIVNSNDNDIYLMADDYYPTSVALNVCGRYGVFV